jgi:hypothetical protein
MNTVWPIFPIFAFATYPEYLEAIAQVEGGVLDEGSAINLVRFQCSIEFLRGLVVSQTLQSWAVVTGDSVQHLRYSQSDLIAYGLRAGWFHAFSDLTLRLYEMTEDLFNRLKFENPLSEAESHTDWFPDSIPIKHIVSPSEPAAISDYLIGMLLAQGNGLLEAEAHPTDSAIEWTFTPMGDDTRENLYSCPPQLFRSTLAAFTSKLKVSTYAGHTFFSVRYENEAAACRGRFSFYWSNTAISGYWAKLYLYDRRLD